MICQNRPKEPVIRTSMRMVGSESIAAVIFEMVHIESLLEKRSSVFFDEVKAFIYNRDADFSVFDGFKFIVTTAELNFT